MPGGILIFGAPGAGSSSLGRVVAQRNRFVHLDLDRYAWRWDTSVPYTAMRPEEEACRLMLDEIAQGDCFVISGSMGDGLIWKTFEPRIALAVFLTVSPQERERRLRLRTTAQYGRRVLRGGDMYDNNNRFIESAAGYEANGRLARHLQRIDELTCPVLRLNGEESLERNAGLIGHKLSSVRNTGSNRPQK